MSEEKPVIAAADAAVPVRPDRLTRLNTSVTVLTGICTLIIGVWVKMNEMQLKRNEVQLKEIEMTTKKIESREKVEAASYKFADAFLNQIKGNFTDTTRGTQMAVAALNIIAQASSGGDGTSNAKARSELPLHMALLLGDPGSIVSLDREQEHRDEWCEFAAVDRDDQTRVTAIRALCALARQSVRAGQIDRVDRCTAHIDHLFSLLAESESLTVIKHRADALEAKVRLGIFLKKHEGELTAGRMPPQDARSVSEVVGQIRKRFETSISGLQDEAEHLRNATRNDCAVEGGALSASASGQAAQREQQHRLASIDEALKAAAFLLTPPAGTERRPNPQQQQQQQQQAEPASTSSSPADSQSATIEKLITDLISSDPATRRKARSDLALYRQKAVKPMLDRLQQPQPDQQLAYNLRLGVAIALSRMVQPIILDPDEAALIVQFLASPNSDTRIATADFLMNLESAATLQNVYAALAILLEKQKALPPDTSGSTVKSIAGILGTWARVLTADNLSVNGSPMKVLAAQTAAQLQDELERKDSKAWAQTISTLKELLQRSQAPRQAAAQ